MIWRSLTDEEEPLYGSADRVCLAQPGVLPLQLLQSARLIKTPKVHMIDPGLLAVLTGTTPERIERDRKLFGPILESFVFTEILKQATWNDDALTLTHYRDKDQYEVDVVIENTAGETLGVEVKAAASVRSSDFNGLRQLAKAVGKDFRLGLVIYDGNETIPFGDNLFAAPISCLCG